MGATLFASTFRRTIANTAVITPTLLQPPAGLR